MTTKRAQAMLIKSSADIAALIRDRRKHRGLDQEALARSVGVSRKWIVEVERGKPGAHMDLVFRTLNALGISLQIPTSAILADPRKKKFIADDLDVFLDSLKRRGT